MTSSINFALVTIIATTLTLASAETIIMPTSVRAQTSSPPGAPGSQLASLNDEWWQRIFSTDITTQPNPFTRIYHGDCSQLTQGNTMFLVGQIFGFPSVSSHGTCIISPQTSLLIPLINGVDIDCTSKQQQSPQKPPGLCTFDIQIPARGQPFTQLRNSLFVAAVRDATNLVATIDGKQLQHSFSESPPGGFEANLAAHDIFGFNVGPVTLHGVADGFWVLLPSLPIGTHSLTFGACLPSLGCQTNTYTIVVR
jgi:hypothetical protein